MDSFQLGDNEEEDKDDEEPKAKKAKLSADAKKNKKYGAIWMVYMKCPALLQRNGE